SGTEFLERSMALRPDAVRIILTGYTDIDAIIQAINKSRIYRYVTKPWESEELRLTLRRAVEAFLLVREKGRLVEELRRADERLATEKHRGQDRHLVNESRAPHRKTSSTEAAPRGQQAAAFATEEKHRPSARRAACRKQRCRARR